MKIIAKYPIIVQGKKENRVVLNDKYEGGFDNAEGSTPAPKKTFAQDLAAIADSGAIQSGASIVNQIKDANKKAPQASNPTTGMNTVATGQQPSSGHDAPKKGMSAGAKVGIVLALVGVGVVIYLVKHKKAAK